MAAGKAEARIIDANLNRVAEALRVAEDICRFYWNLPGLSRELKELRHGILQSFAPDLEGRSRLAGERDIEEDVGRAVPETAVKAEDLAGSAVRNLQRAKEALRTLEEVGRLQDPEAASRAGEHRYQLYSIEKGILALASRGPGQGTIRMAGVRLYLIATGEIARIPLVEAVRSAIAGGAGAVQMREKGLPDRLLLSLGRELREVTAREGVPLIVNDRPDLALLIGADGVHLGQEDLPVSDARTILGSRGIIGVSTHSVEEARRAAREGADYIGMGAAFETPTKKVDRTLGPAGLKPILEATDLPAFAIGGINPENAPALAAAGCSRVCVSSGILALETARKIEEAARAIVTGMSHIEAHE